MDREKLDPVPGDAYPTSTPEETRPLRPWSVLVGLPINLARLAFNELAKIGRSLRRSHRGLRA
jgi:hypothetical protein